jgi:hypothetical protein
VALAVGAFLVASMAYADTISGDGDVNAGTNNVAYGSAAFQNPCSSRGTPVNGFATIKFNGTTHYDVGATVTVTATPDAAAVGAGITASGGSGTVPPPWNSKPQFFTVPITTTVPASVPDGAYTVNLKAVGAAHDKDGHAAQFEADDAYAVSVQCGATANNAPVIDWNTHPAQANSGDTKTYTFGIHDADSSSWSFASGYPDCGVNGTLSNFSIDSANRDGTFDCTFSGSSHVRVKVTDGSSESNELGQDVTVGAAAAPPVVDAGPPVSGAEGSAIALSGSVTDPHTPSPTILWSYAPLSGVDAGATCSFADATSPTTTITCTDDGVYTATLTADDGTNPPVSDSTTVTVSNASPQVTITAPSGGSSYGSSPVSLSASFSDAGHNDTHTCSIDWGDASPATAGSVTESNGSGTCTGSHTYTTGGTHVITVTVTDDDGGSGQDNVSVTNSAPSVDAGPPASGAEGSAIALSGSVTDPDGPPSTILWSYTPGPGVDAGATCSFADATSPATTITCTDDGTYTATLTAGDGLNPPVSSSTTVTVSNANPQVTITAPPTGSSYGSSPVSLSASFSDAGHNDTHTCSINWGDGSPLSTGTVSESNGSGTCTSSHTYTTGGTHMITVTVTDDDGGTGSDHVSVSNAAPVVDAGPPVSGAEGSAISLSGSVTDTDGPSPTTISWSYAPLSGVDAGATCSFANSAMPATTITCTDDGTYTATLTAGDGLNPPASDSTTVTVSNATPVVTITAPPPGSSYQPGTPVSVSASFTDAGHNDTHTCTIDWGDGSPVSTGTVSESNGSGTCTGSHTYTTAGSGSRTITVRVTDDDGATGQDTVGIAVSSARSLKQDALARTNALIPGASKPDSDKLKQAANEITQSLVPTRWGADDNHVSETKGQEVFDHEKAAVKPLMDLLKGTSIPDASLQPIIDDLMNADQIIAQTEIDDAIAAHGNAMKIHDAQVELGKAASERSMGHFDAAVDHYKHAWEHARDAF